MSAGKRAAYWLVILVIFIIMVWLLRSILLPFVVGAAARVLCDDGVWATPKTVIVRKGLALGHIDDGAAQTVIMKSVDESILVNHRSPSKINKDRSFLKKLQSFGIEDILG